MGEGVAGEFPPLKTNAPTRVRSRARAELPDEGVWVSYHNGLPRGKRKARRRLGTGYGLDGTAAG